MKPGRELDALVAEKVMAWKPPELTSAGAQLFVDALFVEMSGMDLRPRYSTDIAAAWMILDKLDGHWQVSGQEQIGWHVSFVEASAREDRWEKPFEARGETAPQAICLAALKAIGHAPT